MKLIKLYRRRRAVSPILAAILLIGLAVAAGAVLFVVVLPLIDNPGGSVVFDEASCTLTASGTHIVLKNEGTETATIKGITVSNSTYDAVFTFVQFSINKGQGGIKDYTFTDALSTGTYTIEVTFDIGESVDQTISIDLTV
jgi:flagellin-like protein